MPVVVRGEPWPGPWLVELRCIMTQKVLQVLRCIMIQKVLQVLRCIMIQKVLQVHTHFAFTVYSTHNILKYQIVDLPWNQHEI